MPYANIKGVSCFFHFFHFLGETTPQNPIFHHETRMNGENFSNPQKAPKLEISQIIEGTKILRYKNEATLPETHIAPEIWPSQ